MQAIHKGNIFIISAASGTGKTTLVSRLIAKNPEIRVCVSHTTRQPRQGEEHGKHYFFTEKARFEQMIGEGAFLEYADVFGNYYGTSFAAVETLCEQGFDVILEIDVQGAAQVRQKLPESCSIFILPPSLEQLRERLEGRATDSREVIERRLQEAADEIGQAAEFDYVVVNQDLDEAETDLLHIFKACRLNRRNQRVTIEKVLANH